MPAIGPLLGAGLPPEQRRRLLQQAARFTTDSLQTSRDFKCFPDHGVVQVKAFDRPLYVH